MNLYQKRLSNLERLRLKLAHIVTVKGIASYEALRISRELDQQIVKCQRNWSNPLNQSVRGGK